MTGDPLAAIDAAIESRCGHCDEAISPTSPSAYFCGSNCQKSWLRRRATGAASVENSEDPIDLSPTSRMRWAPNMVTREPDDDPDLVPAVNPPAFLLYCGDRFTSTLYRRRATPRWHLRLDDDYRFVGRDLADEGAAQLVDDVWRSLERELTSARRVSRGPIPPCQCPRCRPEQSASDIAALGNSYETLARRARLGFGDPRVFRRSLMASERWPDYRWCPHCLQRSRAVRAEPSYHSFWDSPRLMRVRDFDSGPACGECGHRLPPIEMRVAEEDPSGTICQLRTEGQEVTVMVPPNHLDERSVHDVFDWLDSLLAHRLAGRPDGTELWRRPPWRGQPSRRRSDGRRWVV
ncbi:hypothetical protein I0C86_41560 [Plantactinospora sp. S1510]|uniref:Uncharacterized protein n=1 Tax=Plantactinospora alkalitolerans TaxID=2789879 RepID=A0ABS0HA37_9ACTN|nr:hypothetical protein [Plantactinospora alkalitolerans]MBF9135341.1 hypothetical protein [Plantactinospora alkalitolerans]